MKHAVYIFLLSFFVSSGLCQAQWIEDPGIKTTIQKGIRHTYNMEFAEAEQAFLKVQRAYPDHPAGPFLLAMVDWWKIMIDIRNTSRDDAFIDKLDKVIDLCDTRLDAKENDPAALFFKGGALGFQGRLYATRRSWVKTAEAGKSALPVVYDAEKAAPGNSDIQLGTGIYNYYAAVLPERYPALKPLMFFLPEGNKNRGLKYLRKTAEHGTYAKYEAQFFLLQSYYMFENNPSKALEYARKLHKEFPANPVFHRYVGRAYIQLGRWKSAVSVFREILERCDRGDTGYSTLMDREASYYVGAYALLRKQYGEAIKYFVRCDRGSRVVDKKGPSGFMIMANLQMGMAHDALGQRDYALKQYKKVLSMDEHEDSHDLAKKYQKARYQ